MLLFLVIYYIHCANTDLCTSLEFPTFCTERKGNVVKFIYYVIVYCLRLLQILYIYCSYYTLSNFLRI